MTETMRPAGTHGERPDPGGCVLRGSAAEHVTGYTAHIGEPPRCNAGAGGREGLHKAGCERRAVMQVYGIIMCGEHGEEAATGALEEIVEDLRDELGRSTARVGRPPSPHVEHALRLGYGVIEDRDCEADTEAALLAAFPLRDEEVCAAIHHHVEDPDWNAEAPPYELYRDDRLLIHRHMRLAFEEGADWLVETLEKERIQIAAQAAYALALERDAGLRPGPKRESGRDGGAR